MELIGLQPAGLLSPSAPLLRAPLGSPDLPQVFTTLLSSEEACFTLQELDLEDPLWRGKGGFPAIGSGIRNLPSRSS
ncbi:unnamed protein product [Gadus morhua 'NCC']